MVCYLGLGANLGEPARQLAAAISALAATPGLLLHRLSSVYRTAPVGLTDHPDFLNMVIAVRTDMAPEVLLKITTAVEVQLVRVRSVADGPRTIDVDILLCGETVCQRPKLTIPHPRMHRRQFVLVPLCEIAPKLILPDGTPVAALSCPRDAGVVRLGPLASLVHKSQCSPEGSCDAR